MHDIKWVRENAGAFDAALMRRNADFAGTAARLVDIDDWRKAAIAAAQEAQTLRNSLSRQIGQAIASKNVAKAEALKAEVNALKEAAPQLESAECDATEALKTVLAEIPNLPKADVPDGADEHGNVVYRTHGTKPVLAFTQKEHFDIGEALEVNGLRGMDFEAAAKLSGSRFVVLSSGIARLSRALGQFMLDLHTESHGYTEVNPPLLVRDNAMFGTAQLPKFRDDQFSVIPGRLNSNFIANRLASAEVENYISQTPGGLADLGAYTDYNSIAERAPRIVGQILDEPGSRVWLIPTAEVPLTNLVRDSILDEDTLPRRYTALTPCFRAEAGSAGRDTRGMLRQHQFEKVELVSITTPDASAPEHERMLESAEAVLKALGLHYRVMTLCTGDMGFASQKTYDIEVWMPGQNAYREISSCSVCGDFQARRMNARFRAKGEKDTRFVHTLNGSGVAVGRALIAVIENYQNEDGSITVPDVLRHYMGGLDVIGRAA